MRKIYSILLLFCTISYVLNFGDVIYQSWRSCVETKKSKSSQNDTQPTEQEQEKENQKGEDVVKKKISEDWESFVFVYPPFTIALIGGIKHPLLTICNRVNPFCKINIPPPKV